MTTTLQGRGNQRNSVSSCFTAANYATGLKRPPAFQQNPALDQKPKLDGQDYTQKSESIAIGFELPRGLI
ncbi:hypothetical protein [Sapientia aquatica]|uniref:Uncharacterized protein n=1 Tax=Sapientia aquatica TaxID=1549640 RepID=A0A4R5W5T9_9BURK|nr:hypothetical protein [Sapientia aquatica]TDK68512.1 hypothetical protein E2I14_02935 [Sapientia aquatica]